MSLPELKVAFLNLGFCVVLILDGHLNAITVDGLEKALEDVLVTDASRVIFDCEGLSFTSSAGLRVFLSTVKRMKSRDGTCAFAALSPAVRDIFEMAGFLDTMEIHNSRASALDSHDV
jgi:anti-anti-sigma factor